MPDKKYKRGIILITSYFVIAVLLILAIAFFSQTYTEAKLAQRHKISTQALCIAEAGIERALYDLRKDFENDSTPSWSDGDINGIVCGPDYDAFYSLPYTAASTNLGEGSYAVWLKNINGYTNHIRVRSTGTKDGTSRTIEIYLQMAEINIWDNVIFAGSGAAGTLINGNVDIRGSVHILGTNLNMDDPAMNMAIELTGSASIGNNYKDMPEALRSRVPELDTILFNGETVETLYAELRVKQGIVGLSGTATVGLPDTPGNGYKETMDGVYVTYGFGGNKGAENVYSDNGTDSKYDLGDSASFPSLNDPYAGYTTYKDYLRANAFIVSDSADLDKLANITPTSNFSIVDPYGRGSITADGSGNIAISGLVYVDGGNFNTNKNNAGKRLFYSGKGVIYVSGNVNINTSFLTVGTDSFPGTSIIGIMTPNTITFNESDIDVAGIFYAENKITSMKQTNVAGTFVSNYFDMGTNVPSIFQVPDVIHNLPAFMIGAKPFYVIKIAAWKEE